MAYPHSPGTNSLPARPPASNSRPGFKLAFSSVNQLAVPPSYSISAPSRPTAASYYPTAAAAPQYGPSYSTYPNNHASPGMTGSTSTYVYSQHQQPSQQQNHGLQAFAQAPTSYTTAPRIQNPFPTPGVPGSELDPDMAAQIAHWQSAYVSKDTDKDGKPLVATEYPKSDVPNSNAQPEKKKTVAREGGGKKWTDESLLEWNPSHLRLFVGNLAGETTDESLLKAFARWKSVQKARVIRDKRTTKSKGYGFVSFSDADDFFQAAKEMHGKYIQSHPVVVKKANTEIKVTNVKEKNLGGKKSNNNKSRDQSAGGGYEFHLGPRSGGGVTKPGQKTKNGLKLLG